MLELKIGKELVKQDHNAKLLGIIFNDKQKRNDQVFGKGGVINSLDQKIFLILRLRNFLNNKALIKVAESIFMSKCKCKFALVCSTYTFNRFTMILSKLKKEIYSKWKENLFSNIIPLITQYR